MEKIYDQLREDVTKILKKEYPNGIEIYADYRDELMDDDIARIANSKYPREYFEDMIIDSYDETSLNLADEIESELKEKLISKYGEALLEDNLYDITHEVINTEIGFSYPLEHFYKQEICIDISIDNGDANYDFVNHIVGPHYNNSEGKDKLEPESGLAWLVQQQGYTLEQFNDKFSKLCNSNLQKSDEKFLDTMYHNGIEKLVEQKKMSLDEYNAKFSKLCPDRTTYIEDKFVNQIYDEIANVSSDCSYLVFCTKMTVEEYITALEQKKPITLSKDTNCGLYNDWIGSGSVMEIELKKDVTIPQDKIHKFIPDAALDKYDLDRKSHYNFSIRNCFGISDAFWKKTYIPNPERNNTRARKPGQGLELKAQSQTRDNSLQM